MNSIYRKVLAVALVAALLALLIFASQTFNNQKAIQPTTPTVADIQETLIQEIRRASQEREGSALNATSAPKPSIPMQARPNAIELIAHADLPDTYSVVDVVPELKKEKYTRDASTIKSHKSDGDEHRSWLKSPDSVDNIVKQAGKKNRTFSWLQISRPLDQQEMQKTLAEYDAKFLGSSRDLVRLQVSNDKQNLNTIKDLPWVKGLAALPPELKISPSFDAEIADSVAGTEFPVFITVMSSEMESEFREALANVDVAVGQFDPPIRVFAAIIVPGQVDEIIQLDFVQAIEPISIVTKMHDTAVPAQGVDKLRTLGDLSGTFSGFTGASTPIGVMDTGLNTNHVDIATNRESICAKNLVENEDSDLFYDAGGHGTHVTGTVVGNGFFVPKYAGMAPGVQHIRFAKVLSLQGFGTNLDVIQGMDYLAEESKCIFNGFETEAVRPLIVNVSLGSAGLENDSRSAAARKLDSTIWTYRQLYVIANANSSQYGYTDLGASKNSLPVGASYDSGEIHGFSSHGPTVDNRLTPLVSGTGVGLHSTSGWGSYDSHWSASGTSMASPSVAGLAALLMDASPGHREQPALVRARLMASAIKPDPWLESEVLFPKTNTNGPGRIQAQYGMGMVSGTATMLNNDSEQGWISSGAAVEMENEEYTYHDIEIPEGTSRLDVVMTWDEPATDAIANNVLNDLDLWVDAGADCGSGPCGEYSSQSTIDNVEWVIIQNPDAGTYRLKIDAHSVYSDAPRAALAWMIVRGNSDPQLSVEAAEEIYETPAGENHHHQINLTVSTESYIAKGVSLHIDCRTLDGFACDLGYRDPNNYGFRQRQHAALVQRSDRLGVRQVGNTFNLGEITAGNPTQIMLEINARSAEPMRVYVKAMAWNGKSAHTSFLVRPEGSVDEIDASNAPSNDDFESPSRLLEDTGSMEVDLLVSAMEVGEPLHEDRTWSEARVAGSVWFQRIPEESGLASFVVTPTSREFPERLPKVQVYQVTNSCCGITGARLLASSYWSAQLFLKEGYDYRIRVSVAGESLPLTLNWYRGERPINDNFVDAIELTGESGEISGNNLGATLEVGELYGSLSSSVWYKWTAPDDGQWEFLMENAKVVHTLAFVGADVSDLRLISDFQNPGNKILINAQKGQTYRIMVASPNAYSGGWVYEALAWNRVEESISVANDMLEDAEDLGNSEYGSVSIDHDNWSSIEPDEPEATGILSRWWKWQAPHDGTFTFFWTGADEQVASAYTGSVLNELESAMLDSKLSSETEFLLSATEGEEYWISAGRDQFSLHAFEKSWTYGNLSWGSTPSNNSLEYSTKLAGDQGEVSGSTVYATTERDQWTQFGNSSLWYTHEVSEGGWVRFWVESNDSRSFRIAAFSRNGENGDLEFIMASRSDFGQSGHLTEVFVYLEEGMQAVLRVAIEHRNWREDFTLRWEATDAPSWLTYVGRLSYGRRDGNGDISRIQAPKEISFNTDGTGLFVTASDGLHSYRRDPVTGKLTLAQVIEDVPSDSVHIWDPHRSQLYVSHGSDWWTYSAGSDDPEMLELKHFFQESQPFNVYNIMGTPTMAIGSNGDYIYRLTWYGQYVYDFSEDGAIRFYGEYRDPKVKVFTSNNGQFWYGFDDFIANKGERILGSPFFEYLHDTELPTAGSFDDPWLIQNDASNKFTFISRSSQFRVYDNQSSDYEFVHLATEYNLGTELGSCGGSFPREDRYVLDIVCDTGGYVVEYDPNENDARVTDKIVNNRDHWIPDRFGRSTPYGYDLWVGHGIAASPDGRHIYASARENGILVFERFGNDLIDFNDSTNVPMRRLDLLKVGDGLVQFGDDVVTEGCLDPSSWEIGGVAYTVDSSKWQERQAGEEWSDVEGSNVTVQLCTHEPEEDHEYRIVATMDIDGETHEYASNSFARLTYERLSELVVGDGELTLDGRTFSEECVYLSNTEVEGKTYTVFNSKWQQRQDADTPWSDVYGTETSGELCRLSASENLEYRLVGSIMVDEERGHRESNIMTDSNTD